MKSFVLTLVISIAPIIIFGQCSIMANGVESTNLVCAGGTTFRSGVAFNPNFNIYYSVNSGSSSYQIETYDVNGTYLSTTSQGFDYRGLWWNSTLNQLDGNGYNTLGIFVQDLNGTNGYPMGTGMIVIPGMNQPAAHSCGQFDPNTNQIVYYNAGSIVKYDRPTGAYLSSTPITGLPVSTANLNSTSIGYTGCTGMEVVVYDYVLQRAYFINLSTGAYVGTCQLPGTAPTQSNQRMSYANDLLWLYEPGVSTWKGYQVLNTCLNSSNSITEVSCDSYTSPSGNYVWTSTGMYYDTIPNAAGCDSILNIDLTINTVNVGTSQNGLALSADAVSASYQWLDCGNSYAIIPNETNQSYTVTANGSYAVQVTENGCTDTSTCIVVSNVGLNSLTTDHYLLVYPNPSDDGIFTIQFAMDQVRQLVLFDELGRVVELPISIESGIIDGSALASGNYILTIHTDTQTFREKLQVIR